MAKMKKDYEEADVEVVLFEFSDIVTLSTPDDGPTRPDDKDYNSGDWFIP